VRRVRQSPEELAAAERVRAQEAERRHKARLFDQRLAYGREANRIGAACAAERVREDARIALGWPTQRGDVETMQALLERLTVLA
jgi:hypothetical protein